MLKYTMAAFNKTVKDLRLFAHIATIVMQSFMLAYLATAIIFENGNRIINAVLASLTVINFVIYLITYGKEDKKSKKVKGTSQKTYVYTKLFLNAISLASVIYSIYVSAENVTGITMVTAPIMIVLWIAQVALEVIKIYVSRCSALFLDGLEMDFEFVLKPMTKARNVLHDFIGEEREDEDNVSARNRAILTEQAGVDEAARQQKKPGIVGRAWRELVRRAKEKCKKKDLPELPEAESEDVEALPDEK